MMNPKISIIVPVYKVAAYLRSTIDSLLSQDYDNFEIILVDDGSPDESGKICDEYASRDSRVFVYHKENGGVTSARKLGVEKSTGDWIVFVDGDDLLTADALSTWYFTAQKFDADYVLTPMIYCGCKESHLSRMRIAGEFTTEEFRFLLCNEYANCGIGGRIISKRLFDDGTFAIPSDIVNNEDLFMNLNLTKKMKKMYALPKRGLYKYILREGSVSHSHTPEKSWETAYREALRLISEYGDCMGMYIILSLYHRIYFKTVTFEYAQSWLNRIPNTTSFPLRIRAMESYMRYPTKLRYYYMRVLVKLLDCFPNFKKKCLHL